MEKRYAYIAAFFAVAAGVGAFSLLSVPTGMITGGNGAHVGIANYTRGEIWQLNYSYVVRAYTSTIISCNFKNVGSTTYVERMEMHIENLTRSPLVSFYDGFGTLAPSDTKKFRINYTPVLDPGYYLIHVNSTYAGNKIANAWGIFQVIPYYETIPVVIPELGPSVTTGGGGFRVPEVGLPNAELIYERVVSLQPGQKYILPITVQNRGMASLYSVMLMASGTGVVFDATPLYIARIAEGASGVFLLSISVPMNAEPGSYDINFKVAAEGVSRLGSVRVDVTESTSKKYIEDMLANYMFIYSTVKQRLIIIAADGRNITDAFAELELGYSDIRAAGSAYRAGEYDRAEELLDSAKTHLENALTMAEYATIPETRITLPAYLSILIILFVGVLLFTIFHLMKARRKLEGIRLERERLKSGG